jgi:hypothetical protein
VNKAVLFEKKIFENTGVNVGIFFFERKDKIADEDVVFEGLKIKNDDVKKRVYILKPRNHYRAGGEFDEFVEKNKAVNPLNVQLRLITYDEIEKNKGDKKLVVIDANDYRNGKYARKEISVNEYLYDKIKSNILYVRTLDTELGKKAGIYVIQEDFQADGIIASKPYRTHPIQLFFNPPLSIEMQYRFRDYFNSTLEYLREITDSEFMTTYKYPNNSSRQARKYLGLVQVKNLIETWDVER